MQNYEYFPISPPLINIKSYFCSHIHTRTHTTNTMLYPLKFKPQFVEKIWGGNKIQSVLGKNTEGIQKVGESWEISGLEGRVSEISNGFLAENDLNEIIEVYMTDLVGEKIFDEFGLGFPLLIKFIDAAENLSVQVHPDDALAMRRYGMNGKTEMWYVIQADEGAGLYVGFKKGVTKQDYLKAVANGTVEALLEFYPVKPGDAFFIPAGTVHAIGKGVLLTEIQQSSDITYRIFDWNRKDANGLSRELNTAEAEEALNFGTQAKFKIDYCIEKERTNSVIDCDQFKVNVMTFSQPVEKVYAKIDSFIIYICIDGKVKIQHEGSTETIQKGECVLVPSIATSLQLIPETETKLLEVHL